MLDGLNPIVRHLIVLLIFVPLSAAILVYVAAVVAAGGVSTLDWGGTWTDALDSAAVALSGSATTALALFITPLTRQYGVGRALAPVVDGDPDAPLPAPQDVEEGDH